MRVLGAGLFASFASVVLRSESAEVAVSQVQVAVTQAPPAATATPQPAAAAAGLQAQQTAAAQAQAQAALQAAMASCALPPVGAAWKEGVMYKAAMAGPPNATVPPVSQGFNRTVVIDNFCSNNFTLATGFSPTCTIAGGEVRTSLLPSITTMPMLRLSGTDCKFNAISVYKKGTVPEEVELRFEFGPCSSENPLLVPPVGNVAVVVGVAVDDAKQDFDLWPWINEVCSLTTPTTPQPTDVLSFATHFPVVKETPNGKCNATGIAEFTYADVKTEETCRNRCVSNATEAHILGTDTTGCHGFAFTSKTGLTDSDVSCITYTGNVTKATTNDPEWTCYKVTYNASQFQQIKNTTPTMAPTVTASTLRVTEHLGKPMQGYMQYMTPPQNCMAVFEPLWWFRLDEADGMRKNVHVSQDSWNSLIQNLPDAEDTPGVTSAQIVDRVLIDTCIAGTGWSAQECYVPPSNTSCTDKEVWAAIISGFLVAILTWISVWAWYRVYERFARKAIYQKIEDGGSQGLRACVHPQFQAGSFFFITVVSVATCCLFMYFVDAIQRSADCYDLDEFLVVVISVVLSSGLTVFLLVWCFFGKWYPGHGHSLASGGGRGLKKAPTSLMLVHVPDGGHAATPLHSMVSQQHEDGKWTHQPMQSFGSGGSPMGTLRSGGPTSPNASQGYH